MMDSLHLYDLCAVALIVLGLYHALTRTDPLRQIIALNIMGSGVFLLLVALGARQTPPDPVPQALVLTGLVVAISATALALALVRRLATRDSDKREDGH